MNNEKVLPVEFIESIKKTQTEVCVGALFGGATEEEQVALGMGFKHGAIFGFHYGDKMKEKDAEAYRKLGDENYKLFDENRKLKEQIKLLLTALEELSNAVKKYEELRGE